MCALQMGIESEFAQRLRKSRDEKLQDEKLQKGWRLQCAD